MRTPVNGFIFIAMLVSSLSVSAASLCRSVLLAPPTQEQVDTTLESLARMKLEMDLQKAQGSSAGSRAAPLIHSQYIAKRQDFLNRTGMKLSDLTEKLKIRISELQVKTKEAIKSETVRRAQEPAWPEPKFKFQESVSLGDLDMKFIPQFVYLEKNHGFIYMQQGTLKFLDLKTTQATEISADFPNGRISADRKHAYSMDLTGLLSIYSTETLQKVRTLQLDVSSLDLTNRWTRIHAIDVSPSGDKLVVSAGSLAVFSLATGDLVSKGKGYGDAKFRDEYMIVFSSNQSFGKYDLKTDKVTSVAYDSGPNGNTPEVAMDPKSNVFLAVNPNGFALHINFETLDIIGTTQFERFRDIESVPHSKGHFVSLPWSRSPYLILDKVPNFIIDFDGSNANAESSAYKLTLSEDGKTMYALTARSYRYSVDVWKDQR
jgi:hypothetical protein